MTAAGRRTAAFSGSGAARISGTVTAAHPAAMTAVTMDQSASARLASRSSAPSWSSAAKRMTLHGAASLASH